jgi:hypothetical protein
MKDQIISNAFKSVQGTIEQRKTSKVLASSPWQSSLTEAEQIDLIKRLLDLAAHAPYHYKSAERYKASGKTSALPFRAYTLTSNDCRKLAALIENTQPAPGKITNMLWATEVLMMITWLPDVFGEQPLEYEFEPVPFLGNLRNMEHIAATGAAINNILLGATAEGFPNYWSSGGALRHKVARTILDIPMDEILLGSLFIFPKDAHQRDVEIKPGKLRDEGKNSQDWSVRVRL